MSKSFKWVCGLCTYENYPSSQKCVMCYQPCRTPLIREPQANNHFSESSTELIYQNAEVKEGRSEGIQHALNEFVSDANYQEVISKEFEHKAQISGQIEYQRPELSTEHSSMIDCAGATSGVCSPRDSIEEGPARNNELNKKWRCSCCTYFNWNRSLKCVICHTPRTNKNERLKESTGNSLQEEVCSSGRTYDQSCKATEASNNSLLTRTRSVKETSGAYSRLSRSYSSNASLHVRENSPSLTTFRSARNLVERCNKSLSDENLNNIMNKTQDSIASQNHANRNRQFSEDLSKSSQHNAGTSYCGKISKTREGDHQRSWKKSNKRLNWLFLKACVGILDDNIEAVDRYLSYGGNIARTLTADEVNLLNRPSAFDIGHSLVHLAVRFQRHNILALILTPEITKRNLKRSPAILCPEIADHIRYEIVSSIRTRKGDFHCQYFCDYLTFLLPIEIAGLPSSIQRLLFDELLDKDVQKELEDEAAINWCADADRVYALWNRSAGDCLLDSVLQATWGVFDRDNVLRRAMAETMQECSPYFYTRWKEWELMQASLLNFSLSERQCLQEWGFILSLARQPGASLEHCHIFVLSHILRRPIIVYGVKYLKSFQGDTLGFAKFQGVYLPFLWDKTFCWKSPIALGYTRGHFTALVPMENDSKDSYDCSNEPTSCTYLPLMDCDRKLLPIHFTSANQGQLEDHQECILNEWLDCLITSSGVLVAKQKPGKRPPLVARLLDQWLDHYRHLSFRRLGEDGDTEDEE